MRQNPTRNWQTLCPNPWRRKPTAEKWILARRAMIYKCWMADLTQHTHTRARPHPRFSSSSSWLVLLSFPPMSPSSSLLLFYLKLENAILFEDYLLFHCAPLYSHSNANSIWTKVIWFSFCVCLQLEIKKKFYFNDHRSSYSPIPGIYSSVCVRALRSSMHAPVCWIAISWVCSMIVSFSFFILFRSTMMEMDAGLHKSTSTMVY